MKESHFALGVGQSWTYQRSTFRLLSAQNVGMNQTGAEHKGLI